MNNKVLFLLTLTTALSGCGLIKDRSGEYRSAREVPPLVVPDDLDSDALGQLYPVPAIPETNVLEEFEGAPRPQPLSENSIQEVIKIQNLGDERWILSNRDPGEIWPRVRNILNRSGITTTKAEATQGILETAWLEFKGDQAYNHRYRFYVQPGVQLNSTEIKVLHDQVGKEGEAKVVWPEESVDDAREKDMVDILANALAGDVSSGTVSLLAQSIGGEEKVSFVTPQVADPYLLMKLDYERAWASLAYSLGRGGFTTIDQDQSAGIFYVNYTPQEDEDGEGWFSRFFSFGSGEKTLEVNCLVKVSRSDDGVQIRVTDKDSSGMDRKDAIRLLKSIRVNLS